MACTRYSIYAVARKNRMTRANWTSIVSRQASI